MTSLCPKQRSRLASSIRVLLLLLICIRCSDEPLGPPRLDVTTIDPTNTIFAAGDIADCGRTQDNATGALIQSRLAAYPNAIVVPLGDNAYKYGRPIDYANCYEPAWGSFKAITRPVIGNHEYDSSATAAGYAGYFGAAVGPNPGYYYSYDIGTWHIVVLNTYSPRVSTKPTSAQDNWLIADLAANTKPCILGLMHHPRFFSVTNDSIIPPLEGFTSTPWQRLYAAGADLIVTGHAHGYERYVPLAPMGELDLQNGIREIIVGTGGEAQGIYKKVHPSSEVQAPYNTYGVLQLSLLENRYVAKFLATSGGFTDSVSVPNCHRAPAPAPPPPPNSSPTADFTASCTNLSCTFTDLSGDSDGTIVTRGWDYGDGSSGTPPSHNYAAGGTYTVTLTVTDDDGASGTATKQVTVSPANVAPTAAFTSACTNLSCTFTDESTDPNGDGTITTWSWEFGDGTAPSAERNPTYAYAVAGHYDVKLTVTDNAAASHSVSKRITVGSPAPSAPPTAEFTSSCPAVGLTCTFADDGSTDSDGSVSGWSWKFGDGGAANIQGPSHTYAAGGTYTVELIITDNDGSSSAARTHDVTVMDPPLPPNLPPTASFSASCTNLSCALTDLSGDSDGTIVTRGWDYGDGTIGTSPSHNYAAGGTYTVTLTVTDDDGAQGTAAKQVTISPANLAPTAAFTSGCGNLSCTFTDASSDGDGTIASRSWNFGDNTTSTATNPSKIYAAAGTYTVKLTVTDDRGGTGTATKQVTVSPANVAPTAAFTSTCTNLSCTFTDGSSDGDGTIASRSWSFGDNTTSTATNPSKIYAAAGTYTVKLTVTDNRGGTGTTTRSVTAVAANAAPKAFFGSSCVKLVCQFTDRSTDADGNSTIVKWFWEFGNGKTFTTTNPATRNPGHTYAVGGTYKPKLTVTDNKGATGSILHIITVTP